MRKDGPRPAVIGTCMLSIHDIQDADVLLANGLSTTETASMMICPLRPTDRQVCTL